MIAVHQRGPVLINCDDLYQCYRCYTLLYMSMLLFAEREWFSSNCKLFYYVLLFVDRDTKICFRVTFFTFWFVGGQVRLCDGSDGLVLDAGARPNSNNWASSGHSISAVRS